MNESDALEAFRRERGLLAADDLRSWLRLAGLSAEEWAERVLAGRIEDLPEVVATSPHRPPPQAPQPLPAGETRPPQVWMRRPGTCADAALRVVCQSRGLTPPARQLVEADAGLDRIVAAAAALGLTARAVKASRHRLDELTPPFIAHVDEHHWLVVHRVGSGEVVVSDPARGSGRLGRRQFAARWSGWAAVLEAPVHCD